jgi:saccharopine dehydrogenase-like NADP-dependent oxidoreductase
MAELVFFSVAVRNDIGDRTSMKAILFGESGMVGQCVLRGCLQDSDVEMVVAVGRSATRVQNPKLHEIVQS